MDHSLPGSSVHGICQARILEWVAISQWANLNCASPNQDFDAFAEARADAMDKGLHVLLLLLSRISRVRLCATP